MAHDTPRISLVQSVNQQTQSQVQTKTTLTYPATPSSPNQNAAF